jgi:hypothetical protein
MRGEVRRRCGLPTECSVFADPEEFANGSGELGGLVAPCGTDFDRGIFDVLQYHCVGDAGSACDE